eukprot:s888_g12.t1
MDLKTAFLQGEAYDETRDIICQIPPEYGYPPYIGARLKKPGYGLNDAPRRWWQIIDKALLDCGLVPTRADRCTYILYDESSRKKSNFTPSVDKHGQVSISEAIDHLMDPVARNNAQGRRPHGFICLHVYVLFMGGDKVFEDKVLTSLRKDFKENDRNTNPDQVAEVPVNRAKAKAEADGKKNQKNDLMCHIWHLQLIYDKRQQLGAAAEKWSRQQFLEYVLRAMQDADVTAGMLEAMYKEMPDSQKGYVNLVNDTPNDRDLTQPLDEDQERIQVMKQALFEMQARAIKKFIKKRDGTLDTSESDAGPATPKAARAAKAAGKAKSKTWRKKGEESESEPEPAASS